MGTWGQTCHNTTTGSYQDTKMKLMILASLLSLAAADADAFYSSYGYGSYVSPLSYHHYPAPRLSAPLLRTFHASALPHVASSRSFPAVPAVPGVVAKTVQTAPAVIAKAAVVSQPPSADVPVVVSSQDEDKNFAFGYSNINSARHEEGNAYTGVAGSYTDGRTTVNYVADRFGFRRV